MIFCPGAPGSADALEVAEAVGERQATEADEQACDELRYQSDDVGLGPQSQIVKACSERGARIVSPGRFLVGRYPVLNNMSASRNVRDMDAYVPPTQAGNAECTLCIRNLDTSKAHT